MERKVIAQHVRVSRCRFLKFCPDSYGFFELHRSINGWSLKTVLSHWCFLLFRMRTSIRKIRIIKTVTKASGAISHPVNSHANQYRTLYPKVPHEFEWSPGTIFLEDSWQQKRPNHQAYYLYDRYEYELRSNTDWGMTLDGDSDNRTRGLESRLYRIVVRFGFVAGPLQFKVL